MKPYSVYPLKEFYYNRHLIILVLTKYKINIILITKFISYTYYVAYQRLYYGSQ